MSVIGLVLAAGWLVHSVGIRDWRTAVAVVVLAVLFGGSLRVHPAVLAFEVGETERHQVVFRFNPFWGNLSVRVDGRTVVRDLRLFSFHLTKTYPLQVGRSEVHAVVIEKTRPLVAAGIRVQQVRAYVDGVLTAETAT